MRNPPVVALRFDGLVRGAASVCNATTPGRCGRESGGGQRIERQRPCCTAYWWKASPFHNCSPSGREWSCRRIGIDFARQCCGLFPEEQEPGVWLVRTAMVIPENELWLHQPRARAELERALDWAQRNPPKESDPDAILKRLEDGGRTEGKKRTARSER